MVFINKPNEVHNMLIKLIKDANPEKHKTFGEWFDGGNMILPAYIIANWGAVLENMKNRSHINRVTANLAMRGDEYPPETPLYVDESIEEGYTRPPEEE